MLRIAAALLAAPKPAFFGNWRPELMAPLELNSAFCRAMLVGLLNVAEPFPEAPTIWFAKLNCTAFRVLKMSARNSNRRDSWNFQKRNRRTTDVSTLSVGQPRMVARAGDSVPVLP